MGNLGDLIGKNYFLPILATISAAFLGLVASKAIQGLKAKMNKDKESEIGVTFRRVIESLASKDLEVKMSAAISLRRFFDKDSEVGLTHTPYAKQAIDVMSSLLKVTKTSQYQKVLADGLRFVPDDFLKNGDFQRANLSKAFLSSKDCRKNFENADFFQANLSGALLKYAELGGAIFYDGTLTGTIFQGSNFSAKCIHDKLKQGKCTDDKYEHEKCLKPANFQQSSLLNVKLTDSDLRGVSFLKATLVNVDLSNSDISRAVFDGATLINVKFPPEEKRQGTTFVGSTGVGDNLPEGVTRIDNKCDKKKIFISKPGILDIREESYVARVIGFIEAKEFEVVVLGRDTYEQTQVLSKLTKLIDECFAVVVFGFTSTYISKGVFRDNTEDYEKLENTCLATPWCQVEVGISVAKSRDILLLIEPGVTEGVFDESVNESIITRLQMDSCLSINKANIDGWLKNITN